ncbi:hypothetical protein [Novacetimonas hansenii]|uniref:hypothetical protein n=1 Tax=Novacetimonas hansenii TaxID=436 RepID=UPI0009501361|nr:hypothetical protein [Novacetimonas hansenii]
MNAWQDAAQFHPDPPDQRKIAAALAYATSQAAAHPPAHGVAPADLRITPSPSPAASASATTSRVASPPASRSVPAVGEAASPNPRPNPDTKATAPDGSGPAGDKKDGAHK